MITLEIKSKNAEQAINITSRVADAAEKLQIGSGAVLVFCPHTTAGLTINEYADPDVMTDLQDVLRKLVPPDHRFRHSEGNSHAHARALLTGSSVSVIVENGKLQLGTWQGIFFMEYDGPRTRHVVIQALHSGEQN